MARSRSAATALALVAGLLPWQFAATSAPADATDTLSADKDWREYGFQGEGEARVDAVDVRGTLAPTPARLAAAEQLDATVRWNRFGTPQVVIQHGGWLSAPSEADAVDVARSWVQDNRALFGLTVADVQALHVLQDSPLYESPDWGRYAQGLEPEEADPARVIRFEQRISGLRVFEGGHVVLGVSSDGRIAYVSSSITPNTDLQGRFALSPAQAIRAAADDVDFAVGELSVLKDLASIDPLSREFAEFSSSLSPDVQRVRKVALPVPGNASRAAYEVTLLDGRPTADGYGNPIAFISFVDAETGEVLVRHNRVDHFAEPGGLDASISAAPSGEPFNGTIPGGPAGTCGEGHVFAVGPDNGAIQATASAVSPENHGIVVEPTNIGDITMKLEYQGQVVATQDLLGSPEVLTYAPPGGVAEGDYTLYVCRYNEGEGVDIDYVGLFSAQPAASPSTPFAKWRVFPGNPNDPYGAAASRDIRQLYCFNIEPFNPGGCSVDVSNTASRVPWDVRPGNPPSSTTDGNNASTAISEASFLTPDTAADRPYAPDRNYSFPWNDTWRTSSCNPSVYASPNGNDDEASVTNLFVGHNRMHDFTYFLGLTELNSAAQASNFGNTDSSRENDPELGSAQAGRATPNGRDNANQITLQDGVPPITNQYLWQPFSAAFYAPCTDGAYDFNIIAHEYGHLVSNRMTGGPDGSLSGSHSRSMGESWSDLMALELGLAFGTAPAGAEFSVGPYATGDPERGIRNHAANNNPLHFGDFGYDMTGPQVHADGEIWTGTMIGVRDVMVAAWEAEYPSGDAQLQLVCAQGKYPSDTCPGNRRWVQLMFDGFLLQPSDTSMLDSRDAILAADMLRYGGENQATLWRGYSRFGMGIDAAGEGAEDFDPTAGFASPVEANGTLRFVPRNVGQGVPENLEVRVGRFEARVTPQTDTDPTTEIDDTLEIAPGTYDFIARADGFGALRFRMTVLPGANATVQVPMRRNVASLHNAARITGDGVNLKDLIDDTEATNWASLTSEGTASEGKGEGALVEGRQVTIELFDPTVITDVQVSALNRPGCTPDALSGECEPLDGETEPDPDPGATQNRFLALRSFDVYACDATTGADCTADASYTLVLASPDDAFPAVRPRPRVNDLNIRAFDVVDARATHVRMVVRDNQCTGGPDFQGDANPDNDPANNPDCDQDYGSAETVRAAEFQVFGMPPASVSVAGAGAVVIDNPVRRIAGINRYDTAAAISRDAFPNAGSAGAVVIARGDGQSGFADALSGTPFAAKRNAPLLLTSPAELPFETEQELKRVLTAGREVYVLGGEAAVSIEVEQRIETLGYLVTRIAGPTRGATAVEVARALGNPSDLLIATGRNFPDALAAGAAAVHIGGAVLLSNDGQRDPATDAYLAGRSNVRTYAIGGPAAIAYREARGIVGQTRHSTATAVARTFFSAPTTFGLARDDAFPDSLAGGLYSARRGGPVLLTSRSSLNGETASYVCQARGTASSGFVYGGTAAVDARVLDAFEARLNGLGC